jgi:hypothetical protein
MVREPQTLTVDDYAIGRTRWPNGNDKSFYQHVENLIKAWFDIVSPTSKKFGIYFGKEASDTTDEVSVCRCFQSVHCGSSSIRN